MKEFPVSETAMIRLKAMVSSILYAVALTHLEADSIDPFPVVEFMFTDLFYSSVLRIQLSTYYRYLLLNIANAT